MMENVSREGRDNPQTTRARLHWFLLIKISLKSISLRKTQKIEQNETTISSVHNILIVLSEIS